jgi:hypothetical protein
MRNLGRAPIGELATLIDDYFISVRPSLISFLEYIRNLQVGTLAGSMKGEPV